MASKSDVRKYIERKFDVVRDNANARHTKIVGGLQASARKEVSDAIVRVIALAKKAGISAGVSYDSMVSVGQGRINCPKVAAAQAALDAELVKIRDARNALIDECLISGTDPAFIARIEAALKKFS